ncbi:AVID protein, partial [Climacteris rufus]|nr:AVID protein [Climacteris rufus]
MVQAIPFLLVLSLALGAHSLSAKKCSLLGNWINDLGSNMTITSMNENGDFSGLYLTAVSSSVKPIEMSPLLGSQHPTNLLKQPTFGFTVHWTFSGALSFLSILCFVDKNQKEVLKTMWLLRLHGKKLEDNWNAT